mmetsp:Transcript_39348/g.76832  ORF Transcript_39348/g.76832 Transcript_39348/m.76832 type:complete len:98 (-) Transcript_39348:598-891(-)
MQRIRSTHNVGFSLAGLLNKADWKFKQSLSDKSLYPGVSEEIVKNRCSGSNKLTEIATHGQLTEKRAFAFFKYKYHMLLDNNFVHYLVFHTKTLSSI